MAQPLWRAGKKGCWHMASILIDGHNLGLVKGTGVATYARNLSLEATHLGHDVSVVYGQAFGNKGNPLLREIAFFDPKLEKPKKHEVALNMLTYGLHGPFSQHPREVTLSGSVIRRAQASRMPECKRIYNGTDLFNRASAGFAMTGRMTKVRLDDQHDLAHWTYPLPIRAPGCPNIYTLHDLVPLRLPYTTLDNKKRYFKLMQRIAREADHIVTVSECSKRDIMDLLGIEETRITNTYQSVHIPQAMLELDEEQVAREVEGATGAAYKEYYLFWGSIEPKKNIERMIEAFLSSGVQRPLVIVGAQAWKSEDSLKLLKNKRLQGDRRIVQLTYAPFTMLVSLIRGARAALFPSLYEGFGLPALEAMTLGTPVIASNTASLPEVVGDAALSVDPYSAREIAAALRKLDNDDDLRDEYVRRGHERVKLFSPQTYRERLESLYRRVL